MNNVRRHLPIPPKIGMTYFPSPRFHSQTVLCHFGAGFTLMQINWKGEEGVSNSCPRAGQPPTKTPAHFHIRTLARQYLKLHFHIRTLPKISTTHPNSPQHFSSTPKFFNVISWIRWMREWFGKI